MKPTSQNETLFFHDLIGDFDVIDNLIFLPSDEQMENLKSLNEAHERLALISRIVLGHKPIISHGKIEDRRYIFFYSDDTFDYKRVFDDTIEQISFFDYIGLKAIVFAGKEICILNKTSTEMKSIFDKKNQEELPKLCVVFDPKVAGSPSYTYNTLFSIFSSLDAIILIDNEGYKIEKKKGTMPLC